MTIAMLPCPAQFDRIASRVVGLTEQAPRS